MAVLGQPRSMTDDAARGLRVAHWGLRQLWRAGRSAESDRQARTRCRKSAFLSGRVVDGILECALTTSL